MMLHRAYGRKKKYFGDNPFLNMLLCRFLGVLFIFVGLSTPYTSFCLAD